MKQFANNQQNNNHHGLSATVEGFAQLRKPISPQTLQNQSNGLRKPYMGKNEPEIETRILKHGRRCICDADLKKVFQGVGEATFDDFAAQHLRCLIYIVKKHVVGLNCSAPSLKSPEESQNNSNANMEIASDQSSANVSFE